jgi:hypothetical protein
MEMKKYEVELQRVDVTYVTVEVEAESESEASLKAIGEADDWADMCGEAQLGHWEPGHVEELE